MNPKNEFNLLLLIKCLAILSSVSVKFDKKSKSKADPIIQLKLIQTKFNYKIFGFWP